MTDKEPENEIEYVIELDAKGDQTNKPLTKPEEEPVSGTRETIEGALEGNDIEDEPETVQPETVPYAKNDKAPDTVRDSITEELVAADSEEEAATVRDPSIEKFVNEEEGPATEPMPETKDVDDDEEPETVKAA